MAWKKKEENNLNTITAEEMKKRHCDWMPEAFDAFWEAYPNKNRKVMAMINWDRMRLPASEIPDMMRYLEERKNSDEWKVYGNIERAASFLYYQNWVR